MCVCVCVCVCARACVRTQECVYACVYLHPGKLGAGLVGGVNELMLVVVVRRRRNKVGPTGDGEGASLHVALNLKLGTSTSSRQGQQ